MSRTAKVLLRWLVPANELPRGWQVSAPARFGHQGDGWKSNAWSLVIKTEDESDSKRQQSGTAWFLATEALQAWLTTGRKFTLFTSKPIAEGVVERVLSDDSD